MPSRSVLLTSLVLLAVAPLAVPTAAGAASGPSFPKFFTGTLHHVVEDVSQAENDVNKDSVDVAGAKFQRTKKGRWPKKTRDASLRERPYAEYKMTAGTVTFVRESHGAGTCPISFSIVYDAATTLSSEANSLRLTYLKKGRWAVVAGVQSIHDPFSTVYTCGGLTDTHKKIDAPPLLLLIDDEISKSGKLLKGTDKVTEKPSSGIGDTSISSWSWNLAASAG